jgi:peptidoglycan/LPS O-acetylase OafA/YrhL
MPEPVRSDQKYLPGLDGLRALAVTAVVAYHLGYGWAQGGLLGVGVFFTLSGYLITDILVGQFAAQGRMKLEDFWLRRARRLLPALFVMLAVVTVWVNGFARSLVPGYRGDVIASGLYVNNWWYIEQHTSYYAQFAPPAPLDHLWSLAVEEQFYLVWPWAVLLMVLVAGLMMKRRGQGSALAGGPGLGGAAASASSAAAESAGASGYLSQRARWAMAGAALAMVAASAIEMAWLYHPGYDPTRAYEGTDTRAFGLLIGAAVAMVWPTRRGGRTLSAGPRRLLDGAGAVGLAVIVLLVWRTNQYSPFMFRGGLVALSAATAIVVAAVATPGGLVGVALGGRALRWIGVRSYGIYLWHYSIIVLTAPPGTAGSPVTLVRAVAAVAATIVIAALSWKFIEEPIRRGGLHRWSARAAVGAGAAADGGTRPWQRLSALGSPLAVGGMCLLAVAGITAGVTSVNAHQTTVAGTTAETGAAGPPLTQSAAVTGTQSRGSAATRSASMTADGRNSPGGDASNTATSSSDESTWQATTGGYSPQPVVGGPPTTLANGAATVPALPTPPPRTSCTSVVHIGDSTSEGLFSDDYLPDKAQQIPAQYGDVGVRTTYDRVVGATSVVEALPGTPNAYTMASRLVKSGYHGCWVIALGTNDTADVYVGSEVGRATRIKEMMSLIGNQPVMWVEVKSLLTSGPYAEQNMELWNQALQRARPKYPNMRLYDWPAVVQTSWFIDDGIHYTSDGYAHRGQMIAEALAEAFPAN